MATQEVIEEEGDITDNDDSVTPRKDNQSGGGRPNHSLIPISEEASYREGSPIYHGHGQGPRARPEDHQGGKSVEENKREQEPI